MQQVCAGVRLHQMLYRHSSPEKPVYTAPDAYDLRKV